MQKAVFLDRDGVLNREMGQYVTRFDEFHLLPHALPGIGQLMVDSVSSRNMPVVQACALIFAATYILLNLSADIVSIVTNPRLLHPK